MKTKARILVAEGIFLLLFLLLCPCLLGRTASAEEMGEAFVSSQEGWDVPGAPESSLEGWDMLGATESSRVGWDTSEEISPDSSFYDHPVDGLDDEIADEGFSDVFVSSETPIAEEEISLPVLTLGIPLEIEGYGEKGYFASFTAPEAGLYEVAITGQSEIALDLTWEEKEEDVIYLIMQCESNQGCRYYRLEEGQTYILCDERAAEEKIPFTVCVSKCEEDLVSLQEDIEVKYEFYTAPSSEDRGVYYFLLSPSETGTYVFSFDCDEWVVSTGPDGRVVSSS